MRRAFLVAIGLSACVIGGSNEDPSRSIYAVSVDASLDAAPSGPLDAAPALDAARPVDASARDTGAVVVDASPQSCTPRVAAATCDPVKNTGCPLFTQCDVVPEQSTPTGRCVFWTLALGVACSADALSETCDAPNACLNGACHKPCYCNTDCGAGQCCRDDRSLVPGGAFKVCGPC